MKRKSSTPPETWPLTQRLCRRGDNKSIFDRIKASPEVMTWIQGAGVDDNARDRLACTLVTVVGDFLENSKRSRLSISEHKKYFNKLARALNGCAKLLRDGPFAHAWPDSWQEFASQVELRAAQAEMLVEVKALAGRTQGKQSERNDFARALSGWIRYSNDNKFKHTITAEITNAFFPDPDGGLGAEQVRDLVRKGK